MHAIEIRELSKTYPGFQLGPVNLDLPTGCIMGLVGENGAGKTTLIKLIMNTIRRASGTIRVLGADNTQADFSELKNEIGIVLDEAYYPDVLSARKVGSIMKDTYRNWQPDQFQHHLQRFGLDVNKAFKDYSRGMRMKLAIAVALSHQPRLLIMDEPTSGLDPMTREEILEVFNDFTRNEGHSILLSSHIVSDLEKISDYIAFLHQGQLLLCEEKDQLLESYALVKLTDADLADIPPEAIISSKRMPYGVEALIRRTDVTPAITREHTNLEEIILFLAKGENIQ